MQTKWFYISLWRCSLTEFKVGGYSPDEGLVSDFCWVFLRIHFVQNFLLVHLHSSEEQHCFPTLHKI